ncbi:MAG: Effector protein hopD2 [Chlamydiae bacterium]|nr:Effector protein hopD2 [Chlamydiota bacterium]
MKLFYIVACLAVAALFIIIYPEIAKVHSSLLTLNSKSSSELPRMFRMNPLQASGSSQFSEESFKTMISVIPSDKIVIVDLREESHGFLNGDAISWYMDRNWMNAGKSNNKIIEEEKTLLHTLSKRNFTFVYKHRQYPIPYFVHSVRSEQKLVESNSLQYFRLPVADHTRPSDSTVNKFVAFVKNLPEDTWLHFHCSAGKGRSTTFLAMYDMMLNATHDEFDPFITRQELWGGINLLSVPPKEVWKHPHILERTEFIRSFYRYCKENPDFKIKWSEWVS